MILVPEKNSYRDGILGKFLNPDMGYWYAYGDKVQKLYSLRSGEGFGMGYGDGYGDGYWWGLSGGNGDDACLF